MLTYEEALSRYFESDDPNVYTSPSLGTKLQPSFGGSERTDANDGWHFRNINGWLATVYDDGRVVGFVDPDDETPKEYLERVRRTLMERSALELIESQDR
jgi:hypothetical protein